MAQQKVTKRIVRIAADLDADLVHAMDQERMSKGHCSRAAIVRMALADRYQKPKPSNKQVA
jgi:metal-responsive CopG/Arc/MetJ family transcriptional regulator